LKSKSTASDRSAAALAGVLVFLILMGLVALGAIDNKWRVWADVRDWKVEKPRINQMPTDHHLL
jgi:hypothetical protein